MDVEQEIVAAVAAGNQRVAMRLVGALRSADRDEQDRILDAIAVQSSNSQLAVELLVWAVDRLRLAVPALRQVLIRQEDIEDGAQRTLLAVARYVGSFRGDSRFRTWVFTIARREALAIVNDRNALGDSAPTPQEGFVDSMSSVLLTKDLVHRTIDAIGEPFTSAVRMRDIDGMEYSEMAERLGVEIGTVKSRINRGRAMVREALARALVDPGRSGSDEST